MDQYAGKFSAGQCCVQRLGAQHIDVVQLSVKQMRKFFLVQKAACNDQKADTLQPVLMAAHSSAQAACRAARRGQRGAVFGIFGLVKHA